MSLIAELKRRNVFRVGVAYGIVGWLLVEMASVVLPALRLPEWTLTLLVFLVVAGFPLALILAWAFELTPDGVKKTEDVDAGSSITSSTGQKLNYFIIGVLVLALGYSFWERGTERTSDPTPVENNFFAEAAAIDASIAVLAFADMSPKGDQEYLSDGISEELLNTLAQIPELRVAARTSSFQFKGQNLDISEIGRKLNVAHVLEGSVRKAGARLRITAQLIDTDSGFHLWSGSYDRELEDVFAIQDEISAAIVDALVAELGIAPIAAPKAVAAEVSADAYENYLRAKQFLSAPTIEGANTAREHIERAVAAAPDFAPAHAVAASIYYELSTAGFYGSEDFSSMSLAESTALSQVQVERALALNPNLAEAYGIKGRLASRLGRQADALALYEKSLALKPSQSTVQRHYSVLLFDRFNRFDEAIRANELAMAYDPLDHRSRMDLVISLAWLSRFNEAEIQARRIQVEYPPGYYAGMFEIHENRGDTLEALKVASLGRESMLGTGPDSLPSSLAAIGLWREARVLALPGKIDPLLHLGDYEAIAQILEPRLRENPELEEESVNLGRAYALLGRHGEAAALLEPAWTSNNAIITVQVPLRGDIGEALYHTRRALGDDAGAAEVRNAMAEFVRVGEAANLARHAYNTLPLALVDLVGGDRADAAARLKDLIARDVYGFDLGAAPFADIQDDPHVQDVIAAQTAQKALIRRQYLEWACNIDPPAGAWVPDAERCAEVSE